MVHGAPAGLMHNASQARADNLARLKLQPRRYHADDRYIKLRPRQNKPIGGNAARFQSRENMLETYGWIIGKFCYDRARLRLWLQQRAVPRI